MLSEDLEVFDRHLIIFLVAARNSLSKTWNIFINNKNTNKIYFM